MPSKGSVFIGLALILGLASYCIVLLVSKEAPIPLLTVAGFGALVLIMISIWSYWHSLQKTMG